MAQAAWLSAKGERLTIGPTEPYEPAEGEVVIRNAIAALNPVDFKMQDFGFFIEQYPTILGCDAAGVVDKIGKGVTNVKVGQRVLGHALSIETKKPANSAFQTFTVVPAQAVAPLPNHVSFEAASALPLALSTAASGLYQKDMLNLPLPTHDPKSIGKTLLVWGGSSAVGAATIQLAKASGLDVVATASQKNFEMVKELGASQVFDYSTPSIIDDLVTYLKDRNVAGGYDAISDGDTGVKVAKVLAEVGGGFIACALLPPSTMPSGVSGKMVYAPAVHLFDKDIGKAVYVDFLPQALESGQLKPAPKPQVVGHGLESVQEGIDLIKKGVCDKARDYFVDNRDGLVP